MILVLFDSSLDASPLLHSLNVLISRLFEISQISRLLLIWGPSYPWSFFRFYLVNLLALDRLTPLLSGSVPISWSYAERFFETGLSHTSRQHWGSDWFLEVVGYGSPLSAWWYNFRFAMFNFWKNVSDSIVALFLDIFTWRLAAYRNEYKHVVLRQK